MQIKNLIYYMLLNKISAHQKQLDVKNFENKYRGILYCCLLPEHQMIERIIKLHKTPRFYLCIHHLKLTLTSNNNLWRYQKNPRKIDFPIFLNWTIFNSTLGQLLNAKNVECIFFKKRYHSPCPWQVKTGFGCANSNH